MAYRRSYSPVQRRSLAAAGAALPDGSLPIADQHDLKAALADFDGTDDMAVWLVKRAEDLDLTHLVPEDIAAKGDKPGHPFRGNQHVRKDGSSRRGGGAGSATTDGGSGSALSADDMADLQGGQKAIRDAMAKAVAGTSATGSPDGAGTPDDPIDVQGDIEMAAKLLIEGKSVRLNQTEEVATLVDRLNDIVKEAEAKGEKAPNFNLCGVSVPGTNVFCQGNLGIPRVKMPQMKGDAVEGSYAARKQQRTNAKEADIEAEFFASLEASGVKVTEREVDPAMLRASQSELKGPQVAGMIAAYKAGNPKLTDPDAYILTTRDGYVLDGHHRWAMKVGVDAADGRLGDEKIKVRELDMDIGQALDVANAFATEMGIPPKAAKTDFLDADAIARAMVERVMSGEIADEIAAHRQRKADEMEAAKAGLGSDCGCKH